MQLLLLPRSCPLLLPVVPLLLHVLLLKLT
jgi:hypothetical protein